MTTTETTETQADPTILTDDEVAILNAARAVCKQYAERLRPTTYSTYTHRQGCNNYDVGRVTVEADQAEEHIFSLLSASHIYLSYDLTSVQLHDPEHYTPNGRTVPGDLRLVPVA